MKRDFNLNQWLYEARGIYREIWSLLTLPRQIFYMSTGQLDKARNIAYEHFFWKE